MKFKSNAIRIQYDSNMQAEIVISTKENVQAEVEELKGIVSKGKELSVEIKAFKKGRSLDSNAYCFLLCQKIAEKIHSTKELVYKKFIKDVGQFEIMPIKNEAVERWLEVWSSKGLGWFAEVLEDSKLEGYKKVISYYGSSVYDVREMSVLIDEIVSECKSLGIETMTSSELESLKNSWGK